MSAWSIPIGRLFGIDIRLHWTFALLLALVVMPDPQGVVMPGRALALVGIVFGSVVLHELGHAWLALRAGLPVRAITLLPIGGVTVLDGSQSGPPKPDVEIRVALAGPLVNFFIAAVSVIGVLLVYPAARVWLWQMPLVNAANLPRALVWANIYMGLFNLLPAYPMDGGRILRAWLARESDYLGATRRAVMIGQGFATVFIVAGAFLGTGLMLIGLFLFFATQLEERSIMFQMVLESVHLEEVMLTDFRTLSPADTLEDALAKAVHSLQDDFP